MIERYSLPAMADLWSEEQKYSNWLKVELAACHALAQLGEIPEQAVVHIERTAQFSVARVQELERELKHDVIAFLTCLNESVGPEGRYIHLGLTSSDVLDTALALQLVQSLDLLATGLATSITTVSKRALAERDTLMVGRTHGIHAEPITFGFKLCGWVAELKRHQTRLQQVRARVAVGKFSGAVGTFAHLSPRVEELACARLGLTPDPCSTQVISRDHHAEYAQLLALIAGSLDRFCTELRNLQRTDVLEVEEYFAPGQKGSSAMPHKRNPVTAEQLCGLARLVRTHSLAALENMALWHERDISHSSVERVILPDSSILVHYMLVKFNDLMTDLLVHPHNMTRNLQIYGGVIFSQKVLLALVKQGLTREEAYRIVQTHAHAAWNQPDGNFRARLEQDPEIQQHLTPDALVDCFDARLQLKNLDLIYERVLGSEC
ncbi:adenylosuccinate lyase [Candidatus Cyanaurora vandensis]|uniref:adenylosuccinate lyase n=1 Tax=Candidatus Cyanaurora vandensis TaxID=2714958 RepID=UPI00257A2371|nr:adenylosuccinate lyase [Candidatus Cyanaurora vandensis]